MEYHIARCPVCGRLLGSWEGDSRVKEDDKRALWAYLSHLARAHPDRLPELPKECPHCTGYSPADWWNYMRHLFTRHAEELQGLLAERGLVPEIKEVEIAAKPKVHGGETLAIAEGNEFVCRRCGERLSDRDAAFRHLYTYHGVKRLYQHQQKGGSVIKGEVYPEELYRAAAEAFGIELPKLAPPEEPPPEPEGPKGGTEVKKGEAAPKEPPAGPQKSPGEEFDRRTPLGEYIEKRAEEAHAEVKEGFAPPPMVPTAGIPREEPKDEEVEDRFPPPPVEYGPAPPEGGEKKGKKVWYWAAAVAAGGLLLLGLIRALRSGRLGTLLGGRLPVVGQGKPADRGPAQPAAPPPPPARGGQPNPGGDEDIIETPSGRYVVLPDNRGVLPEKYRHLKDKFL